MGRSLGISTSVAVLLWCGVAHAQEAAPQPQEDVSTLG